MKVSARGGQELHLVSEERAVVTPLQLGKFINSLARIWIKCVGEVAKIGDGLIKQAAETACSGRGLLIA